MDCASPLTTKWSQITSKITEILSTPLHNQMTADEKKIHEAAIFLADLHKKYPLDNLTRSDRHPNEHYMQYITELIEARDFETAAVFARLQLRGFDGVVENKNVWTEYIAYVIKHHKKNESSIWKPFIQKLIVLIEEEIIYIRNCLDRPIVFTTFFKLGLNTLEKWKYNLDASTPQNWLLLILRSSMSSYTKTDLIRFLRKIDEKYIPIDSHSVKLIMIYGNTRIFKEWLQISDFSKMQFDNGRNILHEILELRDGQYRDYIDKFEDKLFQRDNKGIYPIEFILRKPSLLLNPKISAVFSRIANQDYAPHYAALKKRFDSLYTGVSLAWAFRSALEGCFNPEDSVNPNFRSTWIRNVKQSELVEKEFPLHNLPLDILCVISEYLSLTTAMSLTMVSKTVHQYFRSDPSFYKRMIQMTRPSIYKQQSIKEDVNWEDLAKNHSRIEYRWNNSTPKSTKIHSYLFSPRSLGRRNQIEAMNDDVLVSCPNLSKLLVYSIHTMKILHSYDASFNALNYRRVSLFQSNAGQDPYLFSVKASELFVYHNGTKYSQNLGTLPRLHMAAIAFNERTVLLENANLLWDVEASKISMKVDITPTSLNSKLVTVPALYNDRSKLLALSTNSELHFVDLRTGKSIWKIEKEPTSLGFMDDNLLAITTSSFVAKLDLRNFKQRNLLSEPLPSYGYKTMQEVDPWMDAASGRLILGTSQFHGYMLWDLREEHWRKVEFRSEVMKINSYAAVGRYKTGLMIEHF